MPEARLTGLVRDAEYASAGPCQARLRSIIQTVSRRSITIVYRDGSRSSYSVQGIRTPFGSPRGRFSGFT